MEASTPTDRNLDPPVDPPTAEYEPIDRQSRRIITAPGSTVAILMLAATLSVWTVIGYVQWINDPTPDGVLPRATAGSIARQAESTVAAPAGRPRRLVLVVIDGLRADRAGRMRSMNVLADLGVDLPVDVGLPSQSKPVYAVLSSGCPQDRSGMRTNSFPATSTVDGLWNRAQTAGLSVAGVSNLDWWRILFPRGFDRYVQTTFESFFQAAALALEGPHDLVLLHPIDVDYAGHQHGARDAYDRAVEHLDRELTRLLEAHVDLDRDAVWIGSDHGHRDKGGHGGAEPEVRFVRYVGGGVGMRHGIELGLVPVSRLAATWAVLMGLAYPWDAEGEPVWEALDATVLGADYLAARRAGWQAHVARYLDALASVSEADFDSADGFEGWRAGMQSLRSEGRSIRLSLAILGVILGLFLVLQLRQDSVFRVILGGASFVGVYVLASWLTQNIDSLSAAEREYRYLLRLASIAVLAFIGQHGVMHFLKIADWGGAYLVGIWLSGASIALVVAYYGIPLTAPLPNAALTFWPLFASLMTFSQAALGGLSLVMLWAVARFGPRRKRSHAVRS